MGRFSAHPIGPQFSHKFETPVSTVFAMEPAALKLTEDVRRMFPQHKKKPGHKDRAIQGEVGGLLVQRGPVK